MLYLSMIKRNIIFISSLLFIFSSCDNDDIPMYFRSMQPSGGKLFEGSIKEYYLNSIPQNMYIGSKDYIFDSTFSDEQKEAQFEKYIYKDLSLKGKDYRMGMIAHALCYACRPPFICIFATMTFVTSPIERIGSGNMPLSSMYSIKASIRLTSCITAFNSSRIKTS